MNKKLTDLQRNHLRSPRVGTYYAVFEDEGERILRVLDEFISLNSKKIVLEIKEIQWAHHGSLKPQVNFKYLEMDILLSGDYLFADEEQIQKFEEYETEELRRMKKREGKKRR
jgi:hypothetical protein